MKATAAKAPVPHPRTNWGWGFDVGQSFYGPAGGIDAGLPWGAVPPPLEANGLGEAAALRAQVGVHPPVGIYFGEGCMTPGRRPRTRGLSRASPSPAPSSPLAWQPRPPVAPRPPPPPPPRAPLPTQPRICGPPLGAMGTVGPELDFEVCAFIIRS